MGGVECEWERWVVMVARWQGGVDGFEACPLSGSPPGVADRL